MRALSSVLVLLAGCSAIDDFGRFTVAAGDMGAAGGCTPGCACISGDAALGVPQHCAIQPSNGLRCSAASASGGLVTLGNGQYTFDTGDGTTPPTLSTSGAPPLVGSVQNGVAVFCVGSLVTSSTGRVLVTGKRPLAIVADSLVRFSGALVIAGAYAVDERGAVGIAGGSNGGDQAMPGGGAGGGRTGLAAGSGTGGSGGASVSNGGPGGGTATSSLVPGGQTSGSGPVAGFGGGGGGVASGKGGGGGGGAGALQISAGWQISFDQVALDASGGGGAGGEASGGPGMPASGGGGGGGGGIVLLEAPDVSISGGCLSVVGGPGGGGGGATRGGDARPTITCGFQGAGGVGGPGGGAGAAPGTMMPAGGSGTGPGGGGGGLGGAGRVTVRTHNPPAMLSGVVPPTAYVAATLP